MNQTPIYSESEQTQAKQYARIRLKLTLLSTLLSFVILAVFNFTPLSQFLAHLSKQANADWKIQTAIFFILFSIIFYIAEFPLHFFSSFTLEHRFQLSNQSLAQWIREELKRQFLSFVLVLTLVVTLYAVMRTTGNQWWWWAWLIWIALSVVMSELMPVVIVPLFYKYQPIDNPILKERIVKMVEPYKLKIENVYSLDLSKKTKKANAMFCGLSKTKRVVLADNLIQHFSLDEIDSVVAHEVGHCFYKHLWKSILFSVITSFFIFRFTHVLLVSCQSYFQFESIFDIAAFPFLCLIFLILMTVLTPLQNALSRLMERQADFFSLQTTKNKGAFISAMQKLARTNLSDPEPSAWVEFWLYSHPSIQKRITFAQHWVSK